MEKEKIKERLLKIIEKYNKFQDEELEKAKEYYELELLVKQKQGEAMVAKKKLSVNAQKAEANVQSVPEMLELDKVRGRLTELKIGRDKLMHEEHILLGLLKINE